MTTPAEAQWAPALGRTVLLRPDTSDRQVFADTFTGLYHVPPPDWPAPRRVLDLGSNIGLTLAHYRAMWPDASIVGVEPSGENAAMAAVNAPGIPVREYAVTGSSGLGSFDVRARHEAFQVVQGAGYLFGDEERMATRCLCLGAVLSEEWGDPDDPCAIPDVDLVKMDVEGSEWAIFADGDWAPHVRTLLVELHPAAEALVRGRRVEGAPDATPALVDRAIRELADLGFYCQAEHAGHPRAVWAWR